MMIIALNVVKVESGLYEGYCWGREDDPSRHASIAEVLRHYGNDIPPDFARFVNVEYAGVHLETVTCERLAQDADALADRIVELSGQVHRAADELGCSYG